jgi:hypothetical protein
MSLFIKPEEVRVLTGFAQKGKQIEQLRRMGIPFFVNAAGRPVVSSHSFLAQTSQRQHEKVWKPAVLTK